MSLTEPKSGVVTIYSTNDAMSPSGPANGSYFNESGGAIAIGRGSDGRYVIASTNDDSAAHRPNGYTVVTREELAKIADAIIKEISQ